MNECIFCSIARDSASKLVWQNDVAVAFNDLHPKAPVHVLVIPRQHVMNLDDLNDPLRAGELLWAVREVAHSLGLKGGWQLRVNNGHSAGQVVDHLHFHILGGRELAE